MNPNIFNVFLDSPHTVVERLSILQRLHKKYAPSSRWVTSLYDPNIAKPIGFEPTPGLIASLVQLKE